jgi:hypothetical protein
MKLVWQSNRTIKKMKLVWQSNRTINFTNSKVELLYGEVDEAELKLVELSSPKQVLIIDYDN